MSLPAPSGPSSSRRQAAARHCRRTRGKVVPEGLGLGLRRMGILVLLGTVLFGCERRQEPPRPPRKTAVPNRPAPPPNRSVPPRNPRTKTPTRNDGSAGTADNSGLPVNTNLPLYELKMDPADLRKLDRSPRSNESYPASFIVGGVVYQGVRVRYRGDYARSWPKKSFKIHFNSDQPFEGHTTLNLNSGWRDSSFIREPLAYHVYAACGVPAPLSRMVCLRLNGQFQGLYVQVEQPEKAFLGRVGLKGASVFKAVSRSNMSDERPLGSEEACRAHYERETRKTEGLGDLQKFCQELERAPNVLDFFTRRVDVEKYINYLAATVLVQNWDCYNKNHFLVYDDRGSQKWVVVPWDLDRTFGDHWNHSFDEARVPILSGTRQSPGVTGWNRMADRFLSEPSLRARFLDRLGVLLEKEFTTAKLFPILNRLEADIGSAADRDRARWGWGGAAEDAHSGIAEVRRYIEQRRAYLLRELPTLRRAAR
jgi:spore coat protein H